MRIAIIGGGIAGLSAAYELEKARAAGAPIEYTLFEGRERLGGSLASEIVNGAVIEQGPDSFLTEKPAAAELCRELGLGEDLLPSNDAARKTYIVVHNRLIALPDGLMFLVPTKLIPTALTRLFSFSTKIRMALELLHPPRPSGLPDEAVAALGRVVNRKEEIGRCRDVFEDEGFVDFSGGLALAGQSLDGVIVGVAAGDCLLEDRRIRGQPQNLAVGYHAAQLSGGDQAAFHLIEPQALPKLLQFAHSTCHGSLSHTNFLLSYESYSSAAGDAPRR